ncbi:Non-hem dioxygenase N-terminal domain protein [Kalmanozyma brasiliensis GHG001]|uniref:Fe2OG dioxygenase domain-containing protein n=1 Tax=Kalmanozyma brasiliensis (strain GHG001) TaxID=1365824 RepID=V5EM85_KALBG|nr:Non-hem dioxygenase N-terminal domain protein [Kalmanozyma brasiliensis GHG001]EST06245.1 Non-hem dioxygenase N-terminal domain protein [Kalmanozyma brasiliensis GHG001]
MAPTATATAPTTSASSGKNASSGSTQQSLSSFSDYHLDYSLWDAANPTSSSSQQFVASLRQAMVGIGFFYLHNTPLSEKRDAMFSLVSRFFALPLEQRMTIDMDQSRHFRGYCKFGDERTQSKQDLRDQVDYAPEVEAVEDEGLRERHPFLNLYGPNQFLSDEVCQGHKETVLDWFATAEEVSNQLTRAIELSLGVEEGDLSQFLTGETRMKQRDDHELDKLGPLPYARMKTIRYPTGDVVDGITRLDSSSTQGVGAHKDSGWLTLLAPSAEVGGLEGQDFSGEWLSIPHVDGSIVVNFGQQVEFLTNGIVQAATHRVVSNPSGKQDRYSVAFFSSPAMNTYLQPLDSGSFSKELVEAWKKAEAKRNAGEIVSDVPKGDLFAKADEPFGWHD